MTASCTRSAGDEPRGGGRPATAARGEDGGEVANGAGDWGGGGTSGIGEEERAGLGRKEMRRKEKERKKNKRNGKKIKWKSKGVMDISSFLCILNKLKKPFCQTFSKTALTPPEKPLHQKSRSYSRFWRSRMPAKHALPPAWMQTVSNELPKEATE